jgi:hypothetical protein
LAAEIPSPAAVTVTVAVPAVVDDEAVNVRVDDPASELSVTGLLLHEAVTPLGKPLTLRVTAPLYAELPVSVIRSVTVLPWITDVEPAAAASVREGGVTVTVNGRFWLAEYFVPLLAKTSALRPKVTVDAAALELPVRVSVQTAAPAELTLGAFHEAVIPLGRPEDTAIVEPAALLATVAPPTDVAVTVTVEVAKEFMLTDAGETARVTPAACCT